METLSTESSKQLKHGYVLYTEISALRMKDGT